MSVTFFHSTDRHPKGYYKVVVTHRNKVSRKLEKKEKIVPVDRGKRQAQADAQDLEIAFKKEFKRGPKAGVSSGSLKVETVGEALEVYLKSKKMHGKNKGADRDLDTDIKQRARFARLKNDFACVPIHEVWEATERFVRKLKTEKIEIHGKRLIDGSRKWKKTENTRSPATINKFVVILRAAIRTCAIPSRNYLGKALIDRNYLDGFMLETVKKKTRHYLSPEERRLLFDNLPEFAVPITYFAMRIPCRVQELLSRTAEHRDVFRHSLLLDGDSAKTGVGRRIHIPTEMVSYFKDLDVSKCQYLFRYQYERKRDNQELGAINYKTLNKAFVAARKAAGIHASFTFHSLRSQAAYDLLVEGQSIAMVMALGGWKSFTAFKEYVDLDQLAFEKEEYERGIGVDSKWKEDLAPKKAA